MFKYNFKEYTKMYVKKSLFKADALILKQIDLNKKVLEVWCASWYMSKYISEELNCIVTWVEYSNEAWEKASKYQKNTYIGDLDNEDFLNTIEGDYDIIIFPAVLEHLKNSEYVLQTLLKLLKKDWKAIVSLPNIAHFSTRFWLLFWNFNYRDYGIMDNTHLKFFTYKTIKDLLKSSWLRIEKFYVSFPFPWANILQKIPLLNKIIYFFVNKIFFRMFWEELIFICKKK